MPGIRVPEIREERFLPDRDAQGGERGDGVNAAGAQKDETGAMATAILEEVNGANEVVVQQFPRAGHAIDAGKDAGVGGAIDDPVGLARRLEVRGKADIAGPDPDAEQPEGLAVGLRAAAAEIIDARDGRARQELPAARAR